MLVSTGKRTFAEIVEPGDRHLIRLYFGCLDGFGGLSRWPDGRGLLDQPVKLVRAMGVIGSTIQKYRKGG